MQVSVQKCKNAEFKSWKFVVILKGTFFGAGLQRSSRGREARAAEHHG